MNRSRSKLDAHAALLDRWLGGMEQGGLALTYDQAAKRLKKKGVECSATGISMWWKRRMILRSERETIAIVAQANAGMRALRQKIGGEGDPKVDALLTLLQAFTWKLMQGKDPDRDDFTKISQMVRDLVALYKVQGDDKDREIADRRVKLLEAEAEKSRQTETALKEKLTPAQLSERIKEIYGIA
jgi:hypothetical protein